MESILVSETLFSTFEASLTREAPLVSVEVKYATNVTNKMVQTSIGHVRGLKAAHGDRYLGHVFVSMQTTNIPDKDSMHFEYDLIEGGGDRCMDGYYGICRGHARFPICL